MEKAKSNEMQKDFWRFMLIEGFLSSVFTILIGRSVAVERLPIQYFLLAGMGALVVTVALYFLVRSWPGRRKNLVVWLAGLLWIGMAVWSGTN